MKWLIVNMRHYTTKLWCFKAAGGFHPQQLRENVYLAPTLGKETNNFLMVGMALPKVLNAYIGEAV